MARQMKAQIPGPGGAWTERVYEGFDRNFVKPPKITALVAMGATNVVAFALEDTHRQSVLQGYLQEQFSGAEIIGVYKLVE